MQSIKISTPSGFIVCLDIDSEVSNTELLTLKKACRILADRLGSAEFKRFCENYQYTKTTYTGMLWWKNYTTRVLTGFKNSGELTGLQVYEHLMLGKEVLSNTADRTLNVHLKIDRRTKRGVLGYTYPSTPKQWIYSWLLKTTPEKIAGNLAHEWVHKMGYGHAYRFNSTREHTVPYAVGYFVGKEHSTEG